MGEYVSEGKRGRGAAGSEALRKTERNNQGGQVKWDQ